MKRIDVAVVGCGRMGALHARTVAADPRCRLVALVDRDPERAACLAALHGGEAHDTVPEGVEAVVVATPASTHAAWIRALAAGGATLLVEKPVVHRLVELPAEDDRVRVAQSERFNPAIRALGGRRPEGVVAVRRVAGSPRGVDVDVTLDLMLHDLDLLVAAWGRLILRESWWSVHRARATLDGPGGAHALVAAWRGAREGVRAHTLLIDGVAWQLDLAAGEARRDGAVVPPPDARDALTAQWDAFVEALGGAPWTGATVSEAGEALRLAEAVRRGAASPPEGVERLR